MKTGVCSITFRSHSIEEVVSLMAESGLDAIEWGGDIHVPHGNVKAASLAKTQTAEAGLEISSYGSYFSPLDADGTTQEFEPILETALALGTGTIRIWAGKLGSDKTPAAYRTRLEEETRRIAEQAGLQGVKLAFEFHADTLTDTNESALRLLRAIGHPNIYSYWQPPYWCADQNYRIQGLELLRDRLLNLHVFQWDFDGSKKENRSEAVTRLPLSAGAKEWRRYLSAVPSGDRYALLEFSRNDSPEQFLSDAAELKKWMETES